MHGFLTRILSKGKQPDAEHHSKVAGLLIEIPGIESANVIKSIDILADKISRSNGLKEKFINFDPETANQWISSPESSFIGDFFTDFFKRHGHRCIREAELREKDWATDRINFIKLIQSLLKHNKVRSTENCLSFEENFRNILNESNFIGRLLIKHVLPKARREVKARENTKSLCIKLQGYFKRAYLKLASNLVESGVLKDEDSIFFLTHKEIGELVRDKKIEYAERAVKRRNFLDQQMEIRFPDISYGVPLPVEENVDVTFDNGVLKGTPTSRGISEGKARIVKTLKDAGNIKHGEIMIVTFTDIGWTPYFSLISGLVTEIGSPLSHGAIVAREYGIPAIVNCHGATKYIKTGQHVILDANKGILTVKNCQVK